MAKSNDDAPFIHALSSGLLALAALYLVLNSAVVMTCNADGRLDSRVAVCRVAADAAVIVPYVPALRRPVAVLEQQGQAARAELVAAVYATSWIGALSTLALMLAVAALRALTVSTADCRHACDHSARRERAGGAGGLDQHKAGAALFVCIILFMFWEVYWGHYQFGGGYSRTANMVDVRDGDLYRLGAFWALLLLFLIVPIGMAVMRVAACRAYRQRGGPAGR